MIINLQNLNRIENFRINNFTFVNLTNLQLIIKNYISWVSSLWTLFASHSMFTCIECFVLQRLFD